MVIKMAVRFVTQEQRVLSAKKLCFFEMPKSNGVEF